MTVSQQLIARFKTHVSEALVHACPSDKDRLRMVAVAGNDICDALTAAIDSAMRMERVIHDQVKATEEMR